MPKVLRIINRFNLGGPTYNVAYLSKYLDPDFKTLLVGGMRDASEDSSEFIVRNLGIEPLIIPEMRRAINPANDLISYRKIKQIIKDFKPDIVHTHAAKAGVLGRRAALKLKVPVIVHTFHGHVFHSYFGKNKNRVFKMIERNLAEKSSKIVAISEKQKNELVNEHKICAAEKVTVIPLGFDLNRFRENQEEKRKQFRDKYDLNRNDVAIGIVGRLVPIKNHSLFLKAIKYVNINSKKKIKGFIIGDGETRNRIEEEAMNLGLNSNRLIFTSWIREIDLAYAGLDIIALTSFNEGTPVSLIEAQAAGKPIVSTKVGGIENAVSEDITALLSKLNDNLQFSKNLLTLVEDESKRKEMEQYGWQFVQGKFHYTRLVNDMKELYYSLLGK